MSGTGVQFVEDVPVRRCFNISAQPERPSPTAGPRTPGAPQAPTTGAVPPADGTPPNAPPTPGTPPGAAPPSPPGKQSTAPPFRGTISAAEVRDFISRLVWQETHPAASVPSGTPSPGAAVPPHPSDAPSPHRAPEGVVPQHAPESVSGRPPAPPPR